MRAAVLIALSACGGSSPPSTAAPVGNAATTTTPAARIPLGACRSPYDCTMTATGCELATSTSQRQASFLEEPGPFCVCAPIGCRREVAAEVSCTSDNECAIEDRGGVEVPARAVPPRTQALRPCEDAEHIPHCEAGRCTMKIYGC